MAEKGVIHSTHNFHFQEEVMEMRKIQSSLVRSPTTHQSSPSSPYLASPISSHHKHSPATAPSSQHGTPPASLSSHTGQPLERERGREGGRDREGGRNEEGERDGEGVIKREREGGRNE